MVLGVFNNRRDTNDVISQLECHNFNLKDLSVIMKDTKEAKDLAEDTRIKVGTSMPQSAVPGALAGGLIGVLTSLGVSDDDAGGYEKSVSTGGILLIVLTTKRENLEVKDLMRYNNAHQIRTVENRAKEGRNYNAERNYVPVYFNQVKKKSVP